MLQIKTFEQQYRGGSFPVRIVADDGKQYVLKMKGAGNGAQSLVQEFIVNRSAAQLGFQVPNVHIIQIPQNFPWEFGTDEFDDIVQKSYGANLGIDYIAGAEPLAELSQIPSESEFLNQMLAIDLFFRNFDRTAQSMNILIDASGMRWLIDHGSCQFLDSHRRENTDQLPTNHFFFGHTLQDTTWLAKFIEFDFQSVLQEIPDTWLAEIHTTASDIALAIECRKRVFAEALSKHIHPSSN